MALTPLVWIRATVRIGAFFALLHTLVTGPGCAFAEPGTNLRRYFKSSDTLHLDYEQTADTAAAGADSPANSPRPAVANELLSLGEPAPAPRTPSSSSTLAAPTIVLPKFEHNIALNHTAGIPSAVTLTTSEADLAQIRVLFVLDGRLLTASMQKKSSGRVFFATFPTPELTMQYQFQFVRNNGSALISETFSANPKCTQESIDRALATAADFDGQAALLRRAAELQQRTTLFDYLTKTVKGLTQ